MIQNTPAALLCLAAIALSTRCVSAQDAVDQATLTVRDVVVLEGSNYEKTLNARTRVDSTLPRSLAGRRPIDSDITRPMPLGIVTFEGTATSDVDVLIEYNGRLMTHVPSASSRARRLLWGRLNLLNEQPENGLALPAGHWLDRIDFSSRLFAEGPSTAASPFLLYDVEHAERPLATIDLNGKTWSAKNTGRDPIHHAALFRPTDDGRFQIGIVETVAGYDSANDEDKQEAAQGEVDPEAAKVVGQVVTGLINSVLPAVDVKSGTTKPDNSPAKKDPGTLAAWTLSEAVDPTEAIRQYVEQFSELGAVERSYLAEVLRARGLNESSATFVYCLDAKTLSRVLPIEVTPVPDRLVRLGVVIVTDADPSLSSEVKRLIALLGDDSWKQREQAEAALRKLGRITEWYLQSAVSHSDAEIAYRSKRILADLKDAKE